MLVRNFQAVCVVTIQITALFWLRVCCFVIFEKTSWNSRLQLWEAAELCNWTLSTSSLYWSGVLRGCKHVALWMRGGERANQRECEGEGEKREREKERDCSVVLYVSLRSCVGCLAPSRNCCCCEKDRTKDSPRFGPLIPLPAQQCYDHTLMECYWNEPR